MFIKKFEPLFIKSNKYISKISFHEGTIIYNYDNNFNLLSSYKILSNSYNFDDAWFDVSDNDDIYGLVNCLDGNMIYILLKDNHLIKYKLLNYNKNINLVKFPSIKKFSDSIHIFYYCIKKNESNFCKLIHYYYNKNSWEKNVIDCLSYGLLTNYIVKFENNVPIIFYLKSINDYEELFMSKFDINLNVWSVPFQITNTKKSKVYLSIIKTFDNLYNIVFSENNFNRFYCTYLNGSINGNTFIISRYDVVNKTIACMFPSVNMYNNTLYVQWIEYCSLYTSSFSNRFNFGWSTPILDKDSFLQNFSGYIYNSNIKENNSLSNLFICENSNKKLGLNDN